MDNQVRRVINGYVHQDYARVNKLQTEYGQIALGVEQRLLLAQYSARESEKQFQNRVLISQNRTTAVFGKISGFMRRVYRPDKLKYSFESEKKPSSVDGFVQYTKKYGNDGQPLIEWVEQSMLHYNGIDPNAMLWNRHEVSDNESNFEPVMFGSAEVKDFKISKGVVDYAIMKRVDTASYEVSEGVNKPVTVDYYYYFTATGLVLAVEYIIDLDKKTSYYERFKEDGILSEGIKAGSKFFIEKEYKNEVPGVSITRVGYKLDDLTKGRSYVSYWHSSLELFKQLVNAGSDLDLLLKLHIFLQKIQYYTDCKHRTPEGGICKSGIINTTKSKCPKCNGTGMEVSTSTQDVLLLKMPDEDSGVALKPSDLVHYVNVPTEIVTIQREIVDEAPQKICESVFGVDISQIPKNAAATATENNNAYDTAQDTLEEFTKAPVKVFKFIVENMAANLKYADLKGELVYPNEYDLESEKELLVKLGLAKENGASPEVIEKLNERIFIKQNRTESNAMSIYNDMRKFQPFGAVSAELRDTYLLSLPDSNIQKALFLNFKEITDTIIAKNESFTTLTHDKKKAVVEGYAKKYSDAAVQANSVRNMEMLDIDAE